MRSKVMVVFGTRPEAIKMAPVARVLKDDGRFDVCTCFTGQHSAEMVKPILDIFNLLPDIEFNAMSPGMGLDFLFSKIQLGMVDAIKSFKPDMVLVHGDTSTASAAALAAFHARVPIGHVEAGLRTGDMSQPFPEEMNRCLIDVLSERFYAPTMATRDNLIREGVSGDNAIVTGNTVIDALLTVSGKIDTDLELSTKLHSKFDYLDPKKRLVLATCHRRENHGDGVRNIAMAFKIIARMSDVQMVLPVHPNPAVRDIFKSVLDDAPGVFLIEPAGYLEFVYLIRRSYMIFTDSGGIQEEAPSLGKPVYVLRDVTERPEAVKAGTVTLVGSNLKRIVAAADQCLSNIAIAEAARQAVNPYGDGKASHRIRDDIISL